ncbi:MAG: hypothetical protein ABW252_02090 [Polyangiales bacterium]
MRDLFCDGDGLQIRSFRELARQLLNPLANTPEESPDDPLGLASGALTAAYLGHSTALSGALVSPINPRAILIGATTVFAFQRGVQQVELTSLDRERYVDNFYLIRFTQSCNERPEGCLPGDLYTPRVESDWTRLTIEDDEALKNTPDDCRQCHQRGREQPILLMRELLGPWSHFFAPDDNSAEISVRGTTGTDLLHDFLRAKGDELYAGIPAAVAGGTAGLSLQNVVPRAQPLNFDSPTIEDERGTYMSEPASGPLPRSPTWDRAYAAFKRGEQLALPHFEGRPTDPAKQAALTAAYARYRAGALPAASLPDLADIFPDDPQTRAEIGLQTEPNATPAEALIQACGSCHNDVLDPQVTRARFNIDLGRMSRTARERAIARMRLPADAEGAMPPPSARKLPPDVRERLAAYLLRDERPAEDDALLERAAELGMAGGARSDVRQSPAGTP